MQYSSTLWRWLDCLAAISLIPAKIATEPGAVLSGVLPIPDHSPEPYNCRQLAQVFGTWSAGRQFSRKTEKPC